MSKKIALIPARSGSQRVPDKNIRNLNGHPLIAYAITSAIKSKIFDRVIVSTDSELIKKIALHYGADVPFLRPTEFATNISPDIEWIKHALSHVGQYDIFSILRPTSPFRTITTIKNAVEKLSNDVDSVRAVELCTQHPGKMWVVDNGLIKPLLDQSHLKVTWHAGQYQGLPKVYIQNSSIEVAWTRVVYDYNSREGKKVFPFFTNEIEGVSIDYEKDWFIVQHLIEKGEADLQQIDIESYGEKYGKNV